MKIKTTSTAPCIDELLRTINDFNPELSVHKFGLGSDKTIIVKTSAFIGVQITRRDNELIVEGSLPSISTAILSGFLMLEGIFYLLESVFHCQWKALEKDIGMTLFEKYG